MANIKDAAVAVRSNLLTIVILVRIKQVVMDSTVYVNAAEIRRNELGQKWIILLKEFF
jgi:predicted amino acid-binding ACT domain protein